MQGSRDNDDPQGYSAALSYCHCKYTQCCGTSELTQLLQRLCTEVWPTGRGLHNFSLLGAVSASLWARAALGSTAQSRGLSLEAHVSTGSQELVTITTLHENWVFNPADLPQSIWSQQLTFQSMWVEGFEPQLKNPHSYSNKHSFSMLNGMVKPDPDRMILQHCDAANPQRTPQ